MCAGAKKSGNLGIEYCDRSTEMIKVTLLSSTCDCAEVIRLQLAAHSLVTYIRRKSTECRSVSRRIVGVV